MHNKLLKSYIRSSMGDFLRTLRSLQPDDNQSQVAIAHLFGLSLQPEETTNTPQTEPEPQPLHLRKPPPLQNSQSSPQSLPSSDADEQTTISKKHDQTPVPSQLSQELETLSQVTVKLTLEKLVNQSIDQSWLREKGIELPRSQDEADTRPSKLSKDSLLHPTQQRAILTDMLASSADDGPVNVEALKELISLGNPITQLPRLSGEHLKPALRSWLIAMHI